ncbi:30S ribosomal protein S4 [Spiroplasma endosymbiont of Amphibalanus improvisus]|uniref:30S ribosomal protein S4 n=1 Tax=Spiroplasma endosymbiont of Amphibalanus improvisus TaxID=3066327 RepID=UPI00313B2431
MSKFTGSKYAKSRRFGFSILETGVEFSKGKKRTYGPGQHGLRRKKISNYGLQLTEKQKVRFMYGLTEKQFRNTFKKSKKLKGVAGLSFLITLESRLDNIVYRMGLANTRSGARQLVNHSHILVNNKKINIPSHSLSVGDKITLREKSKKMPSIQESIKNGSELQGFVKFDKKTLSGEYVRHPERKELNQEINEALIVEWYNRLV